MIRLSIWEKFKSRMDDIFWRTETVASEILVGILLVAWGLWVANPYIDSLVDRHYIFMSFLLPEAYWGIIPMIGGLLLLFGAGTRRKRIRRFGSLISIAIWSFLATEFIMTDFFSLWTPIYITLAGMSVWLHLRQNFLKIGKFIFIKRL